jgi:hypothetical protein
VIDPLHGTTKGGLVVTLTDRVKRSSLFKRRLALIAAPLLLGGLTLAAVALADNLQSDLDTDTGGLDKTVNLGTLPAGTAESQDVSLFVQVQPGATNDPTYPFNVSGTASSTPSATSTGSIFTSASFDGVTISGAGTANGKTGHVSWTTPAAQATTQNYSIVMKFSANTPLNTDPATVTINFSVAGAPANQAPSKPGAPGLTSGSSPNKTGEFTLGWTASTDDGLPNPPGAVSYQLQHKDADDSGYSNVSGATALSTNSFSFTSGSPEGEGTWTYQVRASDGSLQSAYSDASPEIKVDKSAPTAPTASTTPSSPAYGDWFKDSVTVSYGGSTDPLLADSSAGSGVASYSAPETFNTSGSHTYSGKATDNAGNESSAATGTVKVDKNNPTVTVTGCPTSAVVLGSSHTVDVSASDVGESGVDPSNDPSGTNISLPTGTIGHHTETYNAKDNVGHDGSGICEYDVVYDWHGFFRPVDNPSVLNLVKAGSAIPAKFSLSGNQGLAIMASGYPAFKVVTCGTVDDAGTDTIEETVTAGSSSLQYDATTDQYIYVWKTDKSWAGTCRQLQVQLIDGTRHVANFKFTK